jgi:hypothetical protein
MYEKVKDSAADPRIENVTLEIVLPYGDKLYQV